MLKSVLLSFCVCFTPLLFSQSLGTFQRIEAGINGIGFSLETPVAKIITIESAIGFGPSYDLHEDEYFGGLASEMDWNWALLEPSFYASVYGKVFYNRGKRERKGKSLLLNTGKFIGLKAKYVSKSLSDPQRYSNTMLFNLNWGGQRNIGKHWLYGYSVGVGIGWNPDNGYSLMYPAFDFKIAYVLPFFSKGKP